MTSLAILRALDDAATALEFTHDALDCFVEHFIALCVLIYVAGESSGRFWYQWHAEWIGSIDWSASTPSAPPAAPSINPLFDVATELDQFSCKQIRQAFGLRQKVSKTKLIAAAIAC